MRWSNYKISMTYNTMKRLIFLTFLLSFNYAWAQDFRDLYQKVLPSVVKINVEEETPSPDPDYTIIEESLGSGVLIDKEGLVLTASHVVQTAKSIKVTFSDGEEIPAKVISSVPAADVALIKLIWPPKNKWVAPLGDSDQVEIG